MRVNIKPLSINEAFQGRRFKTQKYKQYEKELLLLLENIDVPKNKLLHFSFIVGYSNSQSDLDNFLKPLIDVMQKKYGFNDKMIYRLDVKKVIVKKGKEFIEYDIKDYDI